MIEIKYIYFEVYSVEGGSYGKANPELRNENILLIKPHTNSDGYWGYRNITEGKESKNIPARYTTVDQYWVDFEKYKLDRYDRSYGDLDALVKKCLDNLKPHLRDFKLEELGI